MQSLLLAEQSSDLSEAHEGMADVDWLRACGMAGQRYGVALAVWRYVELSDRTSGKTAFDGCVARLLWRGFTSDPLHVAAEVLTWMHSPICPTCHGQMFEHIAGTPTLSDRPCPACHGTGKKPKAWGPAAHDLHEWLQEQQREAAREISKKLRQG
jgi:hypothetical protein